MSKKTYTIRLEPETHRLVKKVAAAEGRSISSVIERAVLAVHKNQRKGNNNE